MHSLLSASQTSFRNFRDNKKVKEEADNQNDAIREELFTPLIMTRLAPPQGTRLLPRERLLDWLEAEHERKLILLVGPAGCGKTSLATLWRKALITQGNSVLWYNLSPDDDSAQFAAYLVAVLEMLEAGVGQRAKSIVNHAGATSYDAFIAAVVNELDQYTKPVYLVLEDFHVVTASPIRGLVERLLLWAPTNLHVVMTSRIAQPLALAELRAHDQVAELDFSALRFDLAETEAFLRSQGIQQLDPAILHSMQESTDGWATGLQLAAYSMRNANKAQRELPAFTTTSKRRGIHYIDDYFAQIVDDSLSEEEMAFLIRTSACRRFNRELCKLITGNPRSGDFLTKFEADNLFVIPIESDDAEPWYRFHHLFGKFLRDRLRRLPEDEQTHLNTTAARWFAGKGLYAEAIRHSRYAGDTTLRIDLIERVARPMIRAGEFLLVREWIKQLPHDALLARLELLICALWAELGCGRLDEVRWMLAGIEAHPGIAEPAVQWEYTSLRAWYLGRQDDTEAMLVLLDTFTPSPPAIDPLIAYSPPNFLGLALIHADQFERARDVLAPSIRAIAAGHKAISTFAAHSVIALSFLAQGAFRQAGAVMQKGFEAVSNERAGRAEFAGLTAGFAIAAAYAQNELAQAEALLSEHMQMVELMRFPDTIIEAFLVQAKLLCVDDRYDDALRTLDRAVELAEQQGIDRLHAWALNERIDIEIQRGDRPSARELLRQLQHLAGNYHGHSLCAWAEIPFTAACAEASLAAADGDYERTLTMLRELAEQSEARGRLARAAKLYTRYAIVLAACTEHTAAQEAMCKALTLAAPHRMLRIFLDERLPALNLVHQCLSQSALDQEAHAFAEAVVSAAEAGRPGIQVQAEPQNKTSNAAVRLSPREFEILELISRAHSNKSIARALNCSDSTVKWHLRNIFQKLGAVSREDAAVKGRNLKLLS
ncbi:LuxR C-terminal-related transcriptional regulator [Pseudomonas jessenii]|uniref:LuxR C-terminal-related transcriptional regulator n=1 Tax=Pseudomonas jessenii TaxID=77298 RepID=UPI003892671B